MIDLINPANGQLLYRENENLIDKEGNLFPVRNGVTRIVQGEDYTNNFGFQWNKFEKVQVDRDKTSVQISKARFFSETRWDKENLDGKDVLEAGCGAGRFSQVVLEHTKANLYSVDLSEAVEANYRNNNHYGNRLQVFQASIYDMPFSDNSFDKVFCLGVLQHTPDFKKSIFSLASKIKPGGEVVVDFYPITGWWTKIHAKYILRPFTKKMANEKLLRRIDRNANWMIAGYRFFDKIRLGKFFNRFIPVTDIKHTVPAGLNKKDFRDWVVLDTFDMFSPAYDKPQRIATVKKWFREAGLQVTFAGFIQYEMGRAAVVRGIKPND